MTPLFRHLSPSGRHARLSILAFHRVLPATDALFPEIPDAARFGEMLDWMKAWFNVLPLDRAVTQLAAGKLPDRAAAITFDDGYADNVTVALPQLRKRALPATFFIATGFLDGGRMWNDTIIEALRDCRQPEIDLERLGLGRLRLDTPHARRASIDACIAHLKYRSTEERAAAANEIVTIAGANVPIDLMMSSDDVRTLRRAGMQVGAHTITHPILAKLTLDEARGEIEGSKHRVEELIGERVGLFAYPNGRLGDDYLECHARLVGEIGFDAAVSTDQGVAHNGTDLMQLPRFAPWDKTRLRFGARLLGNLLRARPLAI